MLDPLQRKLREEGMVTFSMKVRPGSSRSHVKEILSDGTVKIDIAAVPEEGKANAELVKFLAKEFDVPKSHVEFLSGHTTKTKVVRICAS